MERRTEAVAREVVDAALQVHRALGPGMLESAYEHCLAFELDARGLTCRRQVLLPISYKQLTLEAGYRIDLLVDERVVVEIKSVEALSPVHEAQLLTYLRFAERRLGFLINFNVALLKDGLKRMVL